MKRLLYTLVLLLALSCGTGRYVSNYTYFYKDTLHPQEVVDSLLGKRFTSDYHKWESYSLIGVSNFDSVSITTYIRWIQDGSTGINMTVTEYGNTDTVTVKSKLIKEE